MTATSAYDDYRKKVSEGAKEISRPFPVGQHILWMKAIACEAFDGKHEGLFTWRDGDGRFGFSEGLVNQLMQYTYICARNGYSDEYWEREAFQRGYDKAREEFAKATELYTEEGDDHER